MFIILFLSVLVHYVPIALANDFDLALDEDQAVAHHLEVALHLDGDLAHDKDFALDEDQVKVALDLDGDLAPVNLCNGATGCCGTGKHHHRHFF